MEHRDIYKKHHRQTSNNHAGFGIRLVAHLIDGIILSILLGILSFVFNIKANTGWLSAIYSPGGLVTLLLIMAYFVYFETTQNQATPGKMLMGLKVVRQDGAKMQVRDSVLRYLGKIISAAILMIGFLIVIFDKKKRALHDLIAQTYVIKT